MIIPRAIRLLATLVVIGVVIGLSLQPATSVPDDSIFSFFVVRTPVTAQKFLHVIAYGLIAALWFWTLDQVIKSETKRTLVAITLAVLIGLALEILQTTVPGRYGTLFDVILDALGAVGGVMLFRVSRNPWPGEPAN